MIDHILSKGSIFYLQIVNGTAVSRSDSLNFHNGVTNSSGTQTVQLNVSEVIVF